MSGMCERSAFDTFYHMDNDEKGLVIFYGFDSSIIRYDTKERLWVLTIEHKPDIVATAPRRNAHLCSETAHRLDETLIFVFKTLQPKPWNLKP